MVGSRFDRTGKGGSAIPTFIRKWIAHYAILGPYDFMDIYEAPVVETADRVSLISRSEGAVSAESWQALHDDACLELLEEGS